MKAQHALTLIAPAFLLVLVQLVAALAHPLAGMLAGAVVGGLAWAAPKLLDMDVSRWWLFPAGAFAASAAGVGIPLLSGSSAAPPLIIAPLLAAGAATLIHALTKDDLQHCDVCGRRLTAAFFDCPRCGRVVCEQQCWNFESCRCRSCEETNVPILNQERAWWDRRLGPRIRQGRCQLCLTPAANTDLRTCHQCGRLYCRACWDASNGQCRSCLWTIPGLPERLRKYLIPDEVPNRPRSRPARNR